MKGRMAAVATSTSPSASSFSYSSLLSNRSLGVPRFPEVSVKFPFLNGKSVKALVCVGAGSRSGSRSLAALPDDHGAHASASSQSSAIDFLTLCHRLKTTKRKGWLNYSIKGPESIADHMYRMAVMALIAKDIPGLNRERCIKIAIVHDIAEAIVGDITPSDGVPKAEKSRREQAALKEMCEILGGGTRAEEIKELWEEYENNSSLEANLVKDFDKVEMILQALEYEIEHGKLLDEFFISTAGKFQTEIGKSWAAEIHDRRNALLKSRGY